MSQTFILACVLVGLAAAAQAADSGTGSRPATWAQPVVRAGVPNLHQLTPWLYRSAQPSEDGYREIERLGVKRVINLRAFHSDKDEAAGTAVEREELSVKTWHLEDEDVVRVLRIVKDPASGPYLIHCQHGADRTGLMCAMYRIVIQGWSREEALRELTDGGYGFHAWIWKNIPEYIRKVDLAAIKAAVERP